MNGTSKTVCRLTSRHPNLELHSAVAAELDAAVAVAAAAPVAAVVVVVVIVVVAASVAPVVVVVAVAVVAGCHSKTLYSFQGSHL